MKKILLFLLLGGSALGGLTSCASSSPAAGTYAPARNDDAIIVTLDKEGIDAWTQVAQAMVNRGFSIETGDRSSMTLVSEPKFRNNSVYVRIYAKVIGNAARLTGTLADLKPDARQRPVQYKNKKKGSDTIGWSEMMAVANELKGPITYDKR